MSDSVFINRLAAELTNDPLGRGYSGMTNEQAAADINTQYRTRDRGVVPAYEILEATVDAEWIVLDANDKETFKLLISAGEIRPNNPTTSARFAGLFDAGTTTRASLLALKTESATRGEEIGVGTVSEGHVSRARSL